jgi:hypothetical protein
MLYGSAYRLLCGEISIPPFPQKLKNQEPTAAKEWGTNRLVGDKKSKGGTPAVTRRRPLAVTLKVPMANSVRNNTIPAMIAIFRCSISEMM